MSEPLQVSAEQRASLMTYPSEIAVKAMGLAAAEGEQDAAGQPPFRVLVESLVLPLLAPATPDAIDERPSSAGKYLSVSVRFTVTSQGQLEAIYAALHREPRVLFTL